jgi:hypothetical protein
VRPLIRDPGTDLSRTQITAGRDAHHRPRGVAADELRRHNLAALLERLHLLGPTSRSDLTATMGLNRSTIGDLIGELAALGLVEEGPAQASSGPGRPSPIVRTRPEGAIVLAAEFSVDSVAVATVGLGGHVFGQTREPRPRARVSADSTIRHVGLMAHQLLETLPRNSSLVGVGAGVAGVTRRSDGFVHQAPNLGWRNVAVGEKLSSMFGADQQVLVANEADLGALAEHRRGVGAGVVTQARQGTPWSTLMAMTAGAVRRDAGRQRLEKRRWPVMPGSRRRSVALECWKLSSPGLRRVTRGLSPQSPRWADGWGSASAT